MEYESRQFFKEHEHEEVNGFTVLEAEDGRYHIAEKWDADLVDDITQSGEQWHDYWVPASDLQTRVESGDCEPHAELTDEQFGAVCKKVGHKVKA